MGWAIGDLDNRFLTVNMGMKRKNEGIHRFAGKI